MQRRALALVLTLSTVGILLVFFVSISQPLYEDDKGVNDLPAAIQDRIDQDQEIQLSVVGYALYPSEIVVEEGSDIILVVSTDRSAVLKIVNQDIEAKIGPDSTVSLPFDASTIGSYYVELHFPIPPEQAGNEAAILSSEPIRIGTILVK
ncbi:MAG: hypothetical protein ACE5KG_02505 [Nitrososphaerales archaeon]